MLPGQKRLSASSSRAFASILKIKMASGDFSYLIQLQRSFCCFLEICSLRRLLEKLSHNHKNIVKKNKYNAVFVSRGYGLEF